MKEITFNKDQFYQNIYAITRLIPKGRVSTYGAIAEAIEQKNRARMVGQALNSCPADVPAHRVVNRSGVLSGKLFFGGNRMQELLESEGVMVQEDKVVNFKKVLWNPLEELGE
jgi:methylated-DNA-protein-cysteine methyltransferase-like protein